MSDSLPPPPTSGSGGRLAILGVLLLLVGGGVIFFLMRKSDPTPAAKPTVAATVDAGPPRTVTPSLTTGSLDKPIAPLPPPVPDAGPPPPVDAGVVVANTTTRPRIIVIDDSPCPGQIDQNAVNGVLRSRYTALHDCYARQLRINGDLQGRVVASINVSTSGNVSSVSTSGLTSKSSGLRTCFEDVLKRIHFPAPKGGCARIRQSFTFSPNN